MSASEQCPQRIAAASGAAISESCMRCIGLALANNEIDFVSDGLTAGVDRKYSYSMEWLLRERFKGLVNELGEGERFYMLVSGEDHTLLETDNGVNNIDLAFTFTCRAENP